MEIIYMYHGITFLQCHVNVYTMNQDFIYKYMYIIYTVANPHNMKHAIFSRIKVSDIDLVN